MNKLITNKPLHFLLAGTFLYLCLSAVSIPDPSADQNNPDRRLSDGGEGGPTVDDNELLFREALKNRFHLTDITVRRRLIQDMRFLEIAGGEDEALFPQALELELHRNDAAIRQRLIQLQTLLVTRAMTDQDIDDAERVSVFAELQSQLALPPRLAFRHIYFSRDKHGQRAAALAKAQLHSPELGNSGTDDPATDGLVLGDPFLSGSYFPSVKTAGVARLFGEGFAGALANCPLQQWCGPIRSDYGSHLVKIEKRYAPEPATLEDPVVRQQVGAEIIRRREARALEAFLAEIRPNDVAAR